MSANDSINRRQFLEKSSLLAAAATAVGGARTASAQLNNSAAVSTKPVRLGFIGVGIRGTLLMEAAAGIAGVEIKAVADCYKGHLDRAGELITRCSHSGNYQEILSRRHRRRGDRDPRPLAPEDDAGDFAAGKHVYVEKPMTHSWEEGEAFISAVESGKVLQVGSTRSSSMGCAQKAVEHQEREARADHPGRGQVPPQHRHRRLVLPDPARRRAGDGRLQEASSARRRRTSSTSGASSSGASSGTTRRPSDGPLRGPGDGDAPADGRAGAGERLQLRRHLNWKNYRDVPDQMTSMVPYPEGFVLRLSSTASNGDPGRLLTFDGSEGTLEYSDGSFKYFYEPRTDAFGYSNRILPEGLRRQREGAG